MKYMVLECHPRYVIVLDELGRFIKAENQSYVPGQTLTEIVEYSESKVISLSARRWIGGLAVAAACLVIAFVALFSNMVKTPTAPQVFASIFLTINPEVRIDVDQSEMVLELQGVNQDGKDLIAGYAYQEKNLDLVSDELVERAIEMGYLYDGGKITLSFDAPDQVWQSQTEDKLSRHLENTLREKLSVTIQISKTIESNHSVVIPIPTAESHASITENKNTEPKSYSDSDYGQQSQTPASVPQPLDDSDYDDISDYDDFTDYDTSADDFSDYAVTSTPPYNIATVMPPCQRSTMPLITKSMMT